MSISHNFIFLVVVVFISTSRSCEIFTGMTCTCYESIDLRCTMAKFSPLNFHSSYRGEKFQSIDLKFPSDENLSLTKNSFLLLNHLLLNRTEQVLSITLRFQNFYSFHGQSGTFSRLFQGLSTPYARLTIEFHPLKAKSIQLDPNVFDQLRLNELSIYADSFSTPFESIFNNTHLTHLNIEGAIVLHDPSLSASFHGQIQSLKMTRMIDTVTSDEFPPFPVQSYTIEAHKMRSLDANSFVNYSQLTGLNLIQPDVSITPKILQGLESLSSLSSMSIDAERIADGALKHVKQIQTLILGSYLKMIDSESLHSLQLLRQFDVRYVQFSSLQGNTSCLLTDFINRRRMLGLTVYLPMENPDCDCILVFLNTMIDDGDQAVKCQSMHNDRCLFSSCSIVSEYFRRQQKDHQPSLQPAAVVPVVETPPSIVHDADSPFYPDESTTIRISMEANIYDDLDENAIGEVMNESISTSTTTDRLSDSPSSITDYSTPLMKRLQPANTYLIVSWIPFAIIASCLFLTLIIAMIGYIIYHSRRSISFKLVPQNVPII